MLQRFGCKILVRIKYTRSVKGKKVVEHRCTPRSPHRLFTPSLCLLTPSVHAHIHASGRRYAVMEDKLKFRELDAWARKWLRLDEKKARAPPIHTFRIFTPSMPC